MAKFLKKGKLTLKMRLYYLQCIALVDSLLRKSISDNEARKKDPSKKRSSL